MAQTTSIRLATTRSLVPVPQESMPQRNSASSSTTAEKPPSIKESLTWRCRHQEGPDCDACFVEVLEQKAGRIAGVFKKYPKSGKSYLKGRQDRYFAVIPHSTLDSGDAAAGNLSEVDRWVFGSLAYWENKEAHEMAAQPKGMVELMKIAKVSSDKKSSHHRVIVKHKRGDDYSELVIQFESKRAADEWSYALWDFISKLRLRLAEA